MRRGKGGKPERVNPVLAAEALRRSDGGRNDLYGQYILARYRATGSLVAGCDARDLMAWLDQQAKPIGDLQRQTGSGAARGSKS